MLIRGLPVLMLCAIALTTHPSVNGDQQKRIKAVAGVATPGSKRLMTAVVHRPVKASVRQAKPAVHRPRVALVTKAGATVAGQGGPGRSSLHPTSVAAPVVGGPPVFTTRQIRTTSLAPTTTSSSTSTSTSTTSTSSTTSTTSTSTSTTSTPSTTATTSTSTSTTSTPSTTATTSTSTTTGTTTATTCTTACTLGYYTACLVSQACSGPCCSPGMICSYSIQGTGKCFPPLG